MPDAIEEPIYIDTADDGMINDSADTSKTRIQTADTTRRIPLESPNPIAKEGTNPSVQVNSNE